MKEIEQQEEEFRVRPKEVVLPRSGIVAFESRHAPDFARSTLRHDYSKFLFLIAGEARVRSERVEIRLTSQSLLHVRSDVTHSYEDAEGAPVTLFALCYRDDLLQKEVRAKLSAAPLRHWNLGRADAPLARPFRSNFRELLYEQTMRMLGWESVVQTLLTQLCVRAARLEMRPEGPAVFEYGRESLERVANYLTRMETQFFRPQSLDEAAVSAGISRRRFSALFRKVSGDSWHRHLDRLRIRHAARLLRETERSVLGIAFESGFETTTSFYRAFKRTLKTTPQEYRQAAKR